MKSTTNFYYRHLNLSVSGEFIRVLVSTKLIMHTVYTFVCIRILVSTKLSMYTVYTFVKCMLLFVDVQPLLVVLPHQLFTN